MKITNKPILLVEDDQVDVMTVKRALNEIHVTNPVYWTVSEMPP